jgi:hypothetical protein
MAKIKNVYTCPRCEEGITSDEKPEKCPGCGAKFPALGTSGFAEPVTISEQRQRLGDEVAHRRFVLSLKMEVANDIMNDALNIIQTIPVKKVPVADIRDLVGMAIRIGEIATKYHEFLAAGGTHTPELFIKKSGDTNGNAKTVHGGPPPTREPQPLFVPLDQAKGGGGQPI